MNGTVRIGVQIQAAYEFPFAIIYPYAWILSKNGAALRYYYEAKAELFHNDKKAAPDQEDSDHSVTGPEEYQVNSCWLRFNMRHQDIGWYTLKGAANMRAKNIGSTQESIEIDFSRYRTYAFL